MHEAPQTTRIAAVADIHVREGDRGKWADYFKEISAGADVNHILLKAGKNMNWERLLFRMDPHWHLLLSQLLQFQFVYPSEYHDIIPRWLFDELMRRAHEQYDMPPPFEHVCRGPIIDQTQYAIDVKEWDYKALTIKTV